MPQSCRTVFLLILSVLLADFYFARCGGGVTVGQGSAPPEIEDIVDLPFATHSVIDDRATDESDNDFTAALRAPAPLQAVGGLRVDAAISDAFDEGSSMAACSMYSAVRRFVMYAGRGDAFLCLLQRVLEEGDLPETDPYDGGRHVFEISTNGSALCDNLLSCPAIHLVFSVDSDRRTNDLGVVINGKINSFEMSACRDGNLLARMTQAFDEYDFALTTSGNYEGALTSQSYDVTLSSRMDADARYLDQKTAIVNYSQTYGENAFNWTSETGAVTFAQKQEFLSVESQLNGSYAESGTGWSSNFSGKAEIIDENTSRSRFRLSRFFMGVGSGSGTATDGAYIGPGEEISLSESWEGDFTPGIAEFLTSKKRFPILRAAEESPQIPSDPCASPVAEASFKLSDLSREDVLRCTGFLLEDDFPNCWYIVDF